MSNYQTLNNILQAALDRASIGKGGERHGTEEPFEQQGMSRRNRQYGTAFGLGQIDKKLEETVRFFENGQIRRGINELLDIIVYSAGVIIVAEEQLLDLHSTGLISDEDFTAMQAVDGHPDVDNSAGDTPDPVQLNNETFDQFITDEVRDKLIADANKYGMGFGFMDESGRISVLNNDRVVVVKIDHGTDDGSSVADRVREAITKAETQETYAEGQQPQPAGDYQRMPPVSYAFPISEAAAKAFDHDNIEVGKRAIRSLREITRYCSYRETRALKCFANAAIGREVFITSNEFLHQPGWEKVARVADSLVAHAIKPEVFRDPYELSASL